MIAIRSGTVDDVPLLKNLVQGFATFERVSVVITEERLRQDGFGARPKFRVLIAEIAPRDFGGDGERESDLALRGCGGRGDVLVRRFILSV